MSMNSQRTEWKAYPADTTAPQDAPNILLIMHDDVGFGTSSCFGGPVPTPIFDRLAARGLRYNKFHVTAMCSPTRAALLTGRNHHRVGNGAISNLAIDEPGYTSIIPQSAAIVAKVLRQNGYSTAMLGKDHNVPLWECGPLGPFDRWPNEMGFDYFYGFFGADTNQFFPALIENRNPVTPPDDPEYLLDKDLSDKAIGWLKMQQELRPGTPFFLYLAPGTMHAPQQAPQEWIDGFRGRFDGGWDRMREETFRRQREMGIVPDDAVLTPRPKELAAWDSLSPQAQAVYARMMEVAAAQLAYSDHQIGRILEHLEQEGRLDNTLVLFLQGDNGAPMEDEWGSFNYRHMRHGIRSVPGDEPEWMDKAGGPETAQRMPAAWSWAMNTPFQWGKQVASHLGGIRQGLVVSWPRRISRMGEIRSQFHHVTDIVPTIYEAVGITPPASVAGVDQIPLDGASMVYSFDGDAEPSHHAVQYFEMLGNCGIYREGWMAGTKPARAPWNFGATVDPASFEWELYHLDQDYSQSRDVAEQHPATLRALKALFVEEAERNRVYPISASLAQRGDHSNRPSPIRGVSEIEYSSGTARYPESLFPTMKQIARIDLAFTLPVGRGDGVLLVQGDVASGMSVALCEGRLRFLYDPTGRAAQRVVLESRSVLREGKHEVVLGVDIDPAHPDGRRLTLHVDGEVQAHAEVARVYNIIGDAYVGCVGHSPLLAGERRPTVAPLEVLASFTLYRP